MAIVSYGRGSLAVVRELPAEVAQLPFGMGIAVGSGHVLDLHLTGSRNPAAACAGRPGPAREVLLRVTGAVAIARSIGG